MLDLSENSFPQVDLIIYVDGSYIWREYGTCQAGYAITDQHKPLEYQAKLNVKSAPMAELIALTQTCIRAEGMKVNIYTDSCCAFRVAHDFGVLWKQKIHDSCWYSH